MTIEGKAKDLERDRMRLALPRMLNNETSRGRKHEGYESLLTLTDFSYNGEWNPI